MNFIIPVYYVCFHVANFLISKKIQILYFEHLSSLYVPGVTVLFYVLKRIVSSNRRLSRDYLKVDLVFM